MIDYFSVRDRIVAVSAGASATFADPSPAGNPDPITITLDEVLRGPRESIQERAALIILGGSEAHERASYLLQSIYSVKLRLVVLDEDSDVAFDALHALSGALVVLYHGEQTGAGIWTQIIGGPNWDEVGGITYAGRDYVARDGQLSVRVDQAIPFQPGGPL